MKKLNQIIQLILNIISFEILNFKNNTDISNVLGSETNKSLEVLNSSHFKQKREEEEWIIFIEKLPTIEDWKIFLNTYNHKFTNTPDFKLLILNNKDSFDIAAKLGVRHTDEIIYLKSNIIKSNYGVRKINKNRNREDILDYYLYNSFDNVRCYMNSFFRYFLDNIHKIISDEVSLTLIII